MSRQNWNTYAIQGYTYDVANDQRSAGGVHLHQVRQTRNGYWQTRIEQSNGRFSGFGPVRPVDAARGEALYATAGQRQY